MSKKFRRPQTEESNWVLESKLEPGMLRFMAHVIENGLNIGLRTEEDFIRHFPPVDIMRGLAERADLRANILVPTTGVRPKIASRKTAESAGVDLQIALDEGETDASLIVSLFHPDDRVRYLDKVRLWNYVVEPSFWNFNDTQKDQIDAAKKHIAFIIDRAIEDRMLTHREIVEGVTVAQLVKHLPLNEIQTVLEKALSNSHGGKAFTEEDLLFTVPSQRLVEYLPLSLVWDSVVRPKVADRNGLTVESAASATSASHSSTSSNSWNSNPVSRLNDDHSDDDAVDYDGQPGLNGHSHHESPTETSGTESHQYSS